MSLKKILIINLTGLVLFCLDRLTKWLVIQYPPSGDFIIPKILRLELHRNTGIAFGWQLPNFLFFILIVLILGSLFFLLFQGYKKKKAVSIFGITIVLLGAFSNLIDRFAYGQIIDFIDIHFWTVFNLADVMIVAGVGILIIKLLKKC